jgi:hypothetical protein
MFLLLLLSNDLKNGDSGNNEGKECSTSDWVISLICSA